MTRAKLIMSIHLLTVHMLDKGTPRHRARKCQLTASSAHSDEALLDST